MKKILNNLRHIKLFVTTKCNFRCRYCFVSKNSKTISFKTGKKAIDFLFSSLHHDLSLTFFGGEPLLEYNLVKNLVEYAYQKAENLNKKIQFGIVSNGSLITDEILNFCKKYKIIFALSCDGMKLSQDIYRVLENKKVLLN